MKYPIANDYIDTLERVTKRLSGLAYIEQHPEPLVYEEIQAMALDINKLDIKALYREAVNSDSQKLYKGMFSDILSNPHVVNGTAKKRLTLLPYYPDGTTIKNDSGNDVIICMGNNGLKGTEKDSEGNILAEYDIISYLFNGDAITKRLQDEGRDNKYILFFLSQTNQLQESIFERWDDVRIMFDYIENQHLKKYSKEPFFRVDILEKDKAKPEAWKPKPEVQTLTEEDFSIILSTKQRYKASNKTFNMIAIKLYGKPVDLHIYLTTRGKGCLKLGVDWYMLQRALEFGVLSEISNGNRLDILLYVFTTYADTYINKDVRDDYKESINQQIKTFGKATKSNLHNDEMEIIKKLMI